METLKFCCLSLNNQDGGLPRCCLTQVRGTTNRQRFNSFELYISVRKSNHGGTVSRHTYGSCYDRNGNFWGPGPVSLHFVSWGTTNTGLLGGRRRESRTIKGAPEKAQKCAAQQLPDSRNVANSLYPYLFNSGALTLLLHPLGDTVSVRPNALNCIQTALSSTQKQNELSTFVHAGTMKPPLQNTNLGHERRVHIRHLTNTLRNAEEHV